MHSQSYITPPRHSATTTINREEFGLTWNVALERGGWLVSRNIKVEVDIAAVSSMTDAVAQAEAESELDAREVEPISA